MGSCPTKHYSYRKSSQWMEHIWKRGAERYYFIFLSYHHTTFDYSDTECQIKHPHMPIHVRFVPKAALCYFLFIHLWFSVFHCSCKCAAYRWLLVFLSNFPKFFSFFRHSSWICVIAYRLASEQALVTTLAKANFS